MTATTKEKGREHYLQDINDGWVSHFSLGELEKFFDRNEIRDAIRKQIEWTRYESVIDLAREFDDKIVLEELADELWTTVYKEQAVDIYLEIGIGPRKALELAETSIFRHKGTSHISEPVRLLCRLGMSEQVHQLASKAEDDSGKDSILKEIN